MNFKTLVAVVAGLRRALQLVDHNDRIGTRTVYRVVLRSNGVVRVEDCFRGYAATGRVICLVGE